jgi:hypothetical protein
LRWLEAALAYTQRLTQDINFDTEMARDFWSQLLALLKNVPKEDAPRYSWPTETAA